MTLHIDITPKIRKVTAHVDLYVDGRVVGSTEVDLTPDERPNGIPGKTGTVLDGVLAKRFGDTTVNVVANENIGGVGAVSVDSIKAAQAQTMGRLARG